MLPFVVIVLLRGIQAPQMLFRRRTGHAAAAYRDIAVTVGLVRSILAHQVSAHSVPDSQHEEPVQISRLL